MMSSFTAEWLVLRKRISTWVLLGLWVMLATMFAYLLPYLSLTGVGTPEFDTGLAPMLPASLADTILAGFPFYGGVLALILGVLAVGSDFGWDTVKTLFTQGPSRLRILGAKLGAVAATLLLFVVAGFATGAVASFLIATAQGASLALPSLADIAIAVAAGWLILIVWATLGMLLGIATRGTAMAIGIGVLYALVIEGLLSSIAGEVSWLEGTVKLFLRANGYSLVEAIGVPAATLGARGPGSYFGPFVDMGQAIGVLALYAAVFVAVSAVLIRRRDVA